MLLRDEGVQILDPLFSASKWMLLWETVLRTVLGEDVVAEYRVADDAGVRFLCDTRLRTLLVGGCYCAIKGSRFWTPYFSPSKWILLCDTLLAAGPASR